MTNRIWDTYPERGKQMPDLCKRIRPAVRFAYALLPLPFKYRTDDGALYLIKPVDPFTVPFMVNPKPDERARYLVKLRNITTYHVKNGRGHFSPTIAEVIAQIPGELLARTVAFEIMERLETRADGRADISGGDYYRGTTLLYAKREMSAPWDIANQDTES